MMSADGLAALALALDAEDGEDSGGEEELDVDGGLGEAVAEELWEAFKADDKDAFKLSIKNLLRSIGAED